MSKAYEDMLVARLMEQDVNNRDRKGAVLRPADQSTQPMSIAKMLAMKAGIVASPRQYGGKKSVSRKTVTKKPAAKKPAAKKSAAKKKPVAKKPAAKKK